MNNNCNSSNNDLNEEIQENTVEYKIINNYNKHINILNKIYYEQNDKYKQLMDFLKEFKLEKESKIDSNITAPTGKYYIKPHIRTRFFEKLKDCCINDKLTLHFRERQHSDFDKKEGSGIMYDFDLFQDSDKNELHEKPFIELFYIIIKIFIEVIDFKEPLNTYAAIITKKKLVYNEIKKKYKNGFHIIIPGIQLTKQAKILLYNKLLESKDLQIYFAEYFNSPLTTETFDKNSNSVPVYYLYNCKEDSNEPYNLFNMYNIKYKNDLIIAQCSKEDIMNKYNIISELSLNHQAELIEMIYYDLKDEYHQQLLLHQQHFNKFEAEKQRVEATFETERTDADENLDYYKTIVMEILDEKRSESYTSWRDVIYALANINPSAPHKYKSIAEMFSQRNQDKYDSAGFEKLWNEAINSNSANKLTVASLIRWAMEDNKTKYNSLLSKDIKNTISHDVFYSENRVLNGQLYQYHFAYYIYHLFKHKFVCDITKKDTEWYEFVLDRDAHTKGQVYKWRREIRPDNLYLYISNKLPDKINKVIETAEEQVKKHPEKAEQNDYITNRIQKLRSSAQKLYTTEFKKGIIREAEVLFRKRGFINSLNTDQNVMGVGNGVLELSNTPRLIRNFHDHPITLFTDIDYEKYDPLNPNTKLLINGLKDLFPHDEQDAFHYLMYYLASCLDGKPKDSMIFIITGNGCHSKDSLIRMFDGNIKKIQDIQVGELVMGDDNTPREVLELYRGKDQMVKITPTKEKSFIVNINHVLSLKFTNLITIIKRNDSYYIYKEAYRIIWYEYNGLDEPIRKSKTLSSKLLCEEFKLTLFNDKKVIKKGDIIDIKVKNLLTWNKWWLNKSNILLYKSEKLEYSDKDLSIDPYILGYWLGDGTSCRMQIYGDGIENIPCILTRKQAEIRKKQKNPNLDSFSIELLGEDDYYGFELDKNHRYLTADGFVHHNSNGKSFLAELVKSVLGNYGKKMPLSFLTDSRSKAAGADPSLMELKTARLAYYSESNKHEVLNTAKLKEITSQETLSGRGLYEEQSQFRPVCHHMVTTNYHFAIKTTDHGIWRRIVTYEFKILFTPNPNPDNKYEKKENTKFAQEFTYNDEIKKSFLSILVEYYKDLHTNHGGSLKNIMKPTIDKESNKYRNKEDIINRFIDDVCIYSPGNKTCLSELIDKYESWYEFNVDKTGTPIKSEIEKQLENSKLTKFIEKTLSSRILKDIRILEDSLDEDILSANEKLLKDMVDNSKLSYVEYNISHFNPLQI
jgi:phage/plasmid-associated DNA primase